MIKVVVLLGVMFILGAGIWYHLRTRGTGRLPRIASTSWMTRYVNTIIAAMVLLVAVLIWNVSTAADAAYFLTIVLIGVAVYGYTQGSTWKHRALLAAFVTGLLSVEGVNALATDLVEDFKRSSELAAKHKGNFTLDGQPLVMVDSVTGEKDLEVSPNECLKKECYSRETGNKLIPIDKWKEKEAGYSPPCGEAETELIGFEWKKFKTPQPGCRLSFHMATGGGLGEIRINGDSSTTEKLVWGEDAPNYKGENLRFIEVRLVSGKPFEFTVARHPSS